MFPKGSDFVLSSHIPNGKREVFKLDGFDVEANGGDGGDGFTQFKFVEDGGLASCVKSEHEEADGGRRKEERKEVAHIVSLFGVRLVFGFWFLVSGF